jgi:hypothetical protein
MDISARCLSVAIALSVSCGTPPANGPKFQYVASKACSQIVAYTWSEARTEYLAVYADLLLLGIPPGSTRTFELASAGKNMSIQVDMYPRQAFDLYCSDVKEDEHVVTWRAIAGTVTIHRFAPARSDPPASPIDYRVVMTLTNLVFEGPGGQRTMAPGPITLTGQAGGNPFG